MSAALGGVLPDDLPSPSFVREARFEVRTMRRDMSRRLMVYGVRLPDDAPDDVDPLRPGQFVSFDAMPGFVPVYEVGEGTVAICEEAFEKATCIAPLTTCYMVRPAQHVWNLQAERGEE